MCKYIKKKRIDLPSTLYPPQKCVEDRGWKLNKITEFKLILKYLRILCKEDSLNGKTFVRQKQVFADI